MVATSLTSPAHFHRRETNDCVYAIQLGHIRTVGTRLSQAAPEFAPQKYFEFRTKTVKII